MSFIIPVEGQKDQFVISRGKQIALISWDGESDSISIIKTLYEVDEQYPGNVFNDGKCDPSGRLWAGEHKISEISETIIEITFSNKHNYLNQ